MNASACTFPYEADRRLTCRQHRSDRVRFLQHSDPAGAAPLLSRTGQRQGIRSWEKSMKKRIWVVFAILFLRTDIFPYGTMAVGKDNFNHILCSVEICPFAVRTSLDSEGDTWKGLLLGYTWRKNDHLSLLFINGGNEFALQYFAGFGPEISLNGQREFGLKTKFLLNLAIIPMSLSFIPSYNFDAKKTRLFIQAEFGLGLLWPLFFDELKRDQKGSHP